MRISAVVAFYLVVTTLVRPETYFLGDPITVEVPATTRNDTIKAAELLIDGTVISLVVPNGTETKQTAMNVTFRCNFGSSSAPKMSIAELLLPAIGTVRYSLSSNNTRNVSMLVMRRISTSERGKVLTSSTMSQSVIVQFMGNSPVNLSFPSSWNVQLVTKGGMNNTFVPYTSMNVTQVLFDETRKTYTIMGEFNTFNTPSANLVLLVGINNGTSAFNIFSIPGSTTRNLTFEWISANDMKVVGPKNIEEYQLENITIQASGLKSGEGYFWLLASDKDNMKKYAIGKSCAPLDLSGTRPYEFTFDWKVLPLSQNSSSYLPPGKYELFVVYTKSVEADTKFHAQNNPSSGSLGNITIKQHGANSRTAVSFAVSGHAMPYLGDLQARKNISVVVNSIFRETYVEWFKYSGNSTVMNATNGWVPVNNVSRPLVFNRGTNQTIYTVVPELSAEEMKHGIRLYGWGEDCAHKRLLPTFAIGNFTSGNSNSKEGPSKKLSTGAIVGIVCAAVFVCGAVLAACWFWNKKSGTQDTYQSLDR